VVQSDNATEAGGDRVAVRAVPAQPLDTELLVCLRRDRGEEEKQHDL
jgi:hypothetical protein